MRPLRLQLFCNDLHDFINKTALENTSKNTYPVVRAPYSQDDPFITIKNIEKFTNQASTLSNDDILLTLNTTRHP